MSPCLPGHTGHGIGEAAVGGQGHRGMICDLSATVFGLSSPPRWNHGTPKPPSALLSPGRVAGSSHTLLSPGSAVLPHRCSVGPCSCVTCGCDSEVPLPVALLGALLSLREVWVQQASLFTCCVIWEENNSFSESDSSYTKHVNNTSHTGLRSLNYIKMGSLGDWQSSVQPSLSSLPDLSAVRLQAYAILHRKEFQTGTH